MPNRKLVAALAMGLLLVAAACGSSGESRTGAGGEGGGGSKSAAPEASPAAEGNGEIVVQAKEYAFDVPATLNAGETTFALENRGKQPHEMVIFKLTGDKPVAELLKLPEKKAQKYVKIIGGTGAGPGKDAKKPVQADLEAGEYAMICFVPAPDKKPHFMHGMVSEFVVN